MGPGWHWRGRQGSSCPRRAAVRRPRLSPVGSRAPSPLSPQPHPHRDAPAPPVRQAARTRAVATLVKRYLDSIIRCQRLVRRVLTRWAAWRREAARCWDEAQVRSK